MQSLMFKKNEALKNLLARFSRFEIEIISCKDED